MTNRGSRFALVSSVKVVLKSNESGRASIEFYGAAVRDIVTADAGAAPVSQRVFPTELTPFPFFKDFPSASIRT